jgi:hypothetical protein
MDPAPRIAAHHVVRDTRECTWEQHQRSLARESPPAEPGFDATLFALFTHATHATAQHPHCPDSETKLGGTARRELLQMRESTQSLAGA